MASKSESGIKIIAENRKARHEYTFIEHFECGIVLQGTEVKSLRAGRCNLSDSYAQIKNGELFLIGTHISPYEHGNRFNPDPLRSRKLLMHRREINRLYGQVKQQGLTLVPSRIYFSRGKVKVEIALAKGKKLYDKRQSAIQNEHRRSMAQAVKRSGRDT